jgi:hypothetical protein
LRDHGDGVRLAFVAKLFTIEVTIAALERALFCRLVTQQSLAGPRSCGLSGHRLVDGPINSGTSGYDASTLWSNLGGEIKEMTVNILILGAIAMASFAAALFFLRFWRSSKDRFFLFFAAAFGIEAVNRICLAFVFPDFENHPVFYLIRLFAFLLILFAIIDKNLPKKKS